MFNSVLQRNWSNDVIIRPRKPKKLPYVLSTDEILSIMEYISNIKHKAILLTVYSSGLRISEVLNLVISDIDSKQMLIKVRCGKGGKDRFTLLGKENLYVLRLYWKLYTKVIPKPEIQDIFNSLKPNGLSPLQWGYDILWRYQ